MMKLILLGKNYIKELFSFVMQEIDPLLQTKSEVVGVVIAWRPYKKIITLDLEEF